MSHTIRSAFDHFAGHPQGCCSVDCCGEFYLYLFGMFHFDFWIILFELIVGLVIEYVLYVNTCIACYLTQPLKVTNEMVESGWASMKHFLHHLDPDVRKITRRLELLHLERKRPAVFNRTSFDNDFLPKYTIYIYIYIYTERERERQRLREKERKSLTFFYFIYPLQTNMDAFKRKKGKKSAKLCKIPSRSAAHKEISHWKKEFPLWNFHTKRKKGVEDSFWLIKRFPSNQLRIAQPRILFEPLQTEISHHDRQYFSVIFQFIF